MALEGKVKLGTKQNALVKREESTAQARRQALVQKAVRSGPARGHPSRSLQVPGGLQYLILAPATILPPAAPAELGLQRHTPRSAFWPFATWSSKSLVSLLRWWKL